MALIKRTRADAAFSDCVRERVNWICELCNKDYKHKPQGLHCSHYFGRRHKSTRWDKLNAAALCMGCHHKLTENPAQHVGFFVNRLGSLYEVLVEKHRQILRKQDYSEKEIAKHYRKELRQMKEMRAEGHEGIIEFASYF